MTSTNLPPDALDFIQLLNRDENHPLTRGILKGVEKEGLRVTPDGNLSQTPHPVGLGSALTHPLITTDFSESLLEFITPPTHINRNTTNDLIDLHRFSYRNMGKEYIWPLSMPCRLPSDHLIPVAQYGKSNRARMKTIYREGLGLRYGRTMQTVAGLHYNFSLPSAFWAFLQQQEGSLQNLEDYTAAKYFHLIRNFRRYYWLLIYLFGASPAVDASFIASRPHNLQAIAEDTFGLPYATSLRMGDLGYQSSAQASLFVCYNALETYIQTLSQAIHTPYTPYKMLEKDGNKQLNTSLLQIENEFYSSIRPKRTAHVGETALTALCHRGVEYIEIRCLDLDPFNPAGISLPAIRFLDTFLLYCLLLPSPICDPAEFANTAVNQRTVVTEGRKPGVKLLNLAKTPTSLIEWGLDIIEAMTPIAKLLNRASGGKNGYTKALRSAEARLLDPALTPSGRIMSAINSGTSHIAFGLQQAEHHFQHFNSVELEPDLFKRYLDMSEESVQLQKSEEEQEQTPFEDYLANYYQQYQDCVCNRGVAANDNTITKLTKNFE
jgi:glutamate--cysteine ligase